MRLLAVAAGVAVLAQTPLTTAQQPATPYSLLMTAEQGENVVRAWNEQATYVPGELLVKFHQGVAPSAQLRALSVLRRTDGAVSRWIGDVLLLSTPGEPDAESAATALARQPEVEWTQPNYIRPLQTTPNDPSYAQQWNFDQIDMPRAWDINPGASASVTVAVVDTGTTTSNEAFVFSLWTGSRFELVSVPFRTNPDIGSARLLPGRDFAFWTGPVLDLQSHGTHVAGTVLQETNNSLGLAGIAYGAKLMPLKACVGYWEIQIVQSAVIGPGFVDPRIGGGCFDSAIAAAIRYGADNGAQIMNLSVGGPAPSPAIQQAIQYAVEKGTFVAIAVGNEFEFGNPIEYPAAYAAQIDGAVAVGAVGRSRRRAFYSNTGAHVELVAPGGDFNDGGLSGVIYQVAPFTPDFSPADIIRPRFDRYADIPKQGTSMAAPHVAGVAALLYSQGITKPAAIEAALERFATDLGPAGRDDEFGHGLINARAALRGMGLAK